MGVDYLERKKSKKLAKQGRAAAAAERGAGDGKPRRIRTKRGANHRIRKGACFRPPPLPPALAEEDAAAARAEKRAAKGKLSRRQRKKRKVAEAAAAGGGGAGESEEEEEGEEEGSEEEAEAAAAQPPPAAGKRARAPPPPAPAPPPSAAFVAALAALGHGGGPTAVQAGLWACRGDSLAVDAPGTGKTLAYLLPALLAAARAPPAAAGAAAPAALIILPVRELALQALRAARQARRALRLPPALGCAAVLGGVALQAQAEALQEAPPGLLLGTPGRLRALLQAGALSCSRVIFLVLDEADKLLRDAACSADAAALRDACPTRPQRTTLLLSATMPPLLAEALREWLGDGFARVGARAQADAPAAPPSAPAAAPRAAGGGAAAVVSQDVQLCAAHKKPRKLLRYLAALREGEAAEGRRSRARVLLFANSAASARACAELLRRHGHRCGLLHGQKAQAEREGVLQAFRCGQLPLLVATDVAGRGLHLAGLERVVNWDFPPNLEAYVHRVGRAGRAGAPGAALSFITRAAARLAPQLVRLLAEAGQPVERNLALLAAVVEEKARAGQLPEAAGEGEEEAAEAEAEMPQEDWMADIGGEEEERKPLFEAPPPAKAAKRAAPAAAPAKAPKAAEAAAAPAAAPKAAPQAPPAKPKAAALRAPFVAASAFQGARPGYVFGKRAGGLGYHLDSKPKPAARPPAPTRGRW